MTSLSPTLKLAIAIALISVQCLVGAHQDRHDLERNLQRLFHEPQADADQLLAEGKQEDGQALRKISALATEILIQRHAILHETLRLTEEALKREYAEMYAGSDWRINALVLMAKQRAKLRAMVDSYKLAINKWKLLHLLVKHYVLPKEEGSPLRLAAKRIYSLMRDQGLETGKTFELMEDLVEDVVKAPVKPGDDKSTKADIYDDADYLIEEAVGCTECRSRPIDEENYQVRPIIADPELVQQWVKLEADQEILDKLSKAMEQTKGQVLEADDELIDEVFEDDIDALADYFLDSE